MYDFEEELIVIEDEEEEELVTVEEAEEYVYPDLQEKSVIPSAEVQEIVADEGVYGLSKVTVDRVNLQDKTVTPSTEEQIVSADNEYTGLNNVIVNPVPTQEKTATPSKDSQTIIPDEEKFLDKVIINGDDNLSPENIVSGKTIFGTTGEAEVVERWSPQPDWWDIKSILENDDTIDPETGEPYKGKVIFLFDDSEDVSSIDSFEYYTSSLKAIKTSDGAFYTNVGRNKKHTWDKTQDKPCSKGYSTRYAIIYTDETWIFDKSLKNGYTNPYIIGLTNYILYAIFDCNISVNEMNLLMGNCPNMECLEFINDKIIIANGNSKGYVSFNGNKNIIEYRLTVKHLSLEYSNTSTKFAQQRYLTKLPVFTNPEYIGTYYGFINDVYKIKKVTVDFTNLQDANTPGYVWNNCNLLEEVNIEFPEKLIAPEIFKTVPSLKKINCNSTLKLKNSRINYLFYQVYSLEEITFDIDFSLVTSFYWVLSYCDKLKRIKTVIDLTSLTDSTGTFLSNVPLLEEIWIKNLGTGLTISNSPKIKLECLVFLLNNLKDLTGATAKSIVMGTTNKSKLEATTEGQEALANAIAKNWTIS